MALGEACSRAKGSCTSASAANVDRGNLLSMLMLATDVEGDGGGMSDLQLRDETMTLFLAGHETTANALAWTWYLPARNPEVERELHRRGRRPAGADHIASQRFDAHAVAAAGVK